MPEKTVEIPLEHLELLRKNGGRVTPLVTALLQHLHNSKQIHSPQQIKDDLKETLSCDIGFPTVYRAIDRLMQCRLIHRMHRDDGQTMFYACRHPDNEHHHHFICTACRKVSEIDMCLAHKFESHVSRHLEATVTKHIIQLEGICKECQQQTRIKRKKQ